MDALDDSRPMMAPRPRAAGTELLDALPQGVVIFTIDGGIAHANVEFSRLVGVDAAELVNKDISVFLPGVLTASRAAALTLSVEGRKIPVWVETRAIAFSGHDARLATLAERDEQTADGSAFRAVFDNAPYGLVLSRADGTISRANARFLEMFGYTEDELEGQAIDTLVPHRVRPGHAAVRQAYANAPSPRAMGSGRDLMGRKKDGVEFPVEIGLCAVTTDHGPLICAAVIDITERKRSEHRLREANAQLDEFSYVAAHDLRTPVRGIANLVDFIQEDYGESAPERLLVNIKRIRDRVASMERLIDDLLSYARSGKRTTKMETIDLAAMIEELCLTNPPPEGVRLTLHLASQPFEGARTPLLTTIRNLFANAVQHHDRDRMSIAIKSRDEGDYVVIDVADDGPGIPEAAQERVFKLFQTRSTSEKKGSGLGLAVVQRLVSGHGGRIHLISADGVRGCTLRIWWPRFKRSDLDD